MMMAVVQGSDLKRTLFYWYKRVLESNGEEGLETESD